MIRLLNSLQISLQAGILAKRTSRLSEEPYGSIPTRSPEAYCRKERGEKAGKFRAESWRSILPCTEPPRRMRRIAPNSAACSHRWSELETGWRSGRDANFT